MTPILLTALCLIPIGLLLAVGLCRAAASCTGGDDIDRPSPY